jgi:son of sevenless
LIARWLVILTPCIVIAARGVFLTDLTFINDGNRDYIDGKINFKKQQLMFKVLQELNLFQVTKYEFPIENPAFTLLTVLPAFSEDELYTLSLEREPREKYGTH